jgi:DNA-entry nuclease
LKVKKIFISLLVTLAFSLCGCTYSETIDEDYNYTQTEIEISDNKEETLISNGDIPAYSGSAYIVINGNQPDFSDVDKQSTEAFELYSELDSLGRCGVAYANICPELQPTEERGEIGQVKPSGWHTVKYNDLIDGNYLYNRCHLIGYQLAGENANEKNLITGTRYLNVVGMLPFEDEVDDYVDSTGNHVLYRVTPIFEGDNLVASGVQMEAWSVEDEGSGVCFNVYCYNVQPGIEIDYATGDSWESENVTETNTSETADYVLNKNTKKIHLPSCSSVDDMAEKNKISYNGTIEELESQGYSPCKRCLG